MGRHSYIDDGVNEGEPTCTVHIIIIIIIIITGHGIHWELTLIILTTCYYRVQQLMNYSRVSISTAQRNYLTSGWMIDE